MSLVARTTCHVHQRRARRLLVLLAAALAVAAALLVQSLWPPQAATATRRLNLQEAKKRVEELNHQAEQAAEEFNGTRERIAALGVLAQASQARLATARSRVQGARRQVGRILAEEYKDGDLYTVKLLFSDDPETYLLSVSAGASLVDRRLEAVTMLRREQADLQTRLEELKRQQQRLADEERRLAAAKERVRAKLLQAQAVLDSLQSAERARLAQLDRTGSRQSLQQILGRTVPDRPTCAQAGIAPAPQGARVAEVMAYLCAHLGDPYVWAAAGPSAFDCSGLSQQAWLRAGVSLPHNADMQSRYGQRIGAGDLRPGDLVFFYRPISHMGIYVGNGLMIAAPQTGDVVKIQPVNYRKLTAATRL